MVLNRTLYTLFFTLVIISNIHSIKTKKIIQAAEIVNKVNSDPLSTWKAYDYGESQYDVEEFKRTKLGTIIKPKRKNPLTRQQMLKLARVTSDASNLPVNFTWANKAITNCPIDSIRDQSNCGSCWAVATASALSDRFCIQTKGKVRIPLSQEYITACDKTNYGCQGGYMNKVNNWTLNGIITGGEYDSDEGCQMYSIRPCQYPSKKPCSQSLEKTPKCRARKCNNEWYEYKTEPNENVYKTSKWYFLDHDLSNWEENAKNEIMTNGPVTAAFLVKTDFRYYKEGVYVPSNNSYILGGHAVRVIGWGVENGLKYWHVANSWSKTWGENGFFKILRGVNCCYFEEMFSVLVPLIKN